LSLPRRGRRPGPSSTRAEIVSAARRLFAECGYDGASLRAIGREAKVDPSLIVQFFGSKAALLTAAVEWPFDPEEELPKYFIEGRRNVGRRLVAGFLQTWDTDGTRDPILTLLRAAMTEPEAAVLLREFLRVRLYRPILERLGSDQPEIRAELVAAQLAGLGVARYVLCFEPLASAPRSQVVVWVAPSVQRYLTGRLEAL
jgi:AcrR family transcriptional regulator